MADLEEDYSSDGDDDYVPSGEASEGDSDANEAAESGDDEVTGNTKVEEHTGKKKKKMKKKQLKKKAADAPRNRKGGIQLEEGEEEITEETPEDDDAPLLGGGLVDKEILEKKKEEKEKKKADDLWSSFMKDVGGPPKKAKTSAASTSVTGGAGGSASSSASSSKPSSTTPKPAAKKETVTVTKVFDFAGEKISVEEKVASDSMEAKTFLKKQEEDKSLSSRLSSFQKGPTSAAGPSTGIKRPGGLSSVLGAIGKKPKISVLEKSKLDWNKFKSKEGIGEELNAFVKGKSGYVEKQNFLARADLRQYEQERNIRMSQSKVLR